MNISVLRGQFKLFTQFYQILDSQIRLNAPRVEYYRLVSELFNAIKGGPEVGSDFDYAAPLTELCCLGAITRRTGKPVDYDPATMAFKDASLNRLIKEPVRKGWEAGDHLWS